MTHQNAVTWLTIAAMLIAAGMWLGRLQQQVSDLQAKETYLHGTFAVPGAK